MTELVLSHKESPGVLHHAMSISMHVDDVCTVQLKAAHISHLMEDLHLPHH